MTVTVANIGYHGILTICAGYYFSRCYDRAQQTIDRAARIFGNRIDAFERWLKTAKPGSECAELAGMALREGTYTFLAVMGGVVVKYTIKLN